MSIGQVTPAHVYKSFPPSHKVKALSVEKTSSEKPADPAPAPQTETSAPAVPVTPVETPVAPAPVPAPTYATGCGDNSYAQYIYQHESGCNAYSINASSGACGIGQELPCGKSGCSLGDYTCQNAYFTNYANSYGGWANAYNFWNCIGSCYSQRTNTTVYKTATWW